METRKQFEKKVKKLESMVVALTNKATSSEAGMREVIAELGDIRSGSKAEVMQAIADKLLLPIGLRYLVVEVFADDCRLQLVGATRPLN